LPSAYRFGKENPSILFPVKQGMGMLREITETIIEAFAIIFFYGVLLTCAFVAIGFVQA
jgi:hypothetical protein